MSELTKEQIIEFVNKSVRKIGPKVWKLFQDEFNTHLDEPLERSQDPLIISSFITVLFMWGVSDYCYFTSTPITPGWLDNFLASVNGVVKDHLLPKVH
jgi:hypothetical protein